MTAFTGSSVKPAVLLLLGLIGLSVPAAAQQPSQAQISAIRSSCRADFQAHCSGVQPGGRDALACLQKNVAALSPGCRTAVSAVGEASLPKSSEAPAGAAAPTTAERAAAPATSGPSAGATSAAAPAATLAPAVPPSARLVPARPAVPLGMELALFRRACGEDVQVNCPGARPGGGEILACLAVHQARLSPGCRQALAAARGSM
jgi:hypothetical protein